MKRSVKSRRAGTQIEQKKTLQPVPLGEKLSVKILHERRSEGYRPGNDAAPIQRSIQEREDALRSTAAIVSVEPMMHSSRLASTPAKRTGPGGQPA